jgi:hypothetical protein
MKRLVVGALVVVTVSLAGASVAWGNVITATCTTGASAPQQCTGSWYPAAVNVVWQATPAPASVSGCALGIANVFSRDVVTSLSCTASWSDGTSSSYSFPLHVEVSSPTATATPSRPPDSGGWYNQPVTAAVTSSSFSGIASCTATTYAGPSTPSAAVFGTCIDNAGKSVTVASAPFAYDVTPPSLTINANPGDRSVALSWQTGGDIDPMASFVVTRSRLGGHAAATTTVYTGLAGGFLDTHVRNGAGYQYTITAVDQAGNASARTVTVRPGPRLLAPAANAHVSAPPMLSWTPIRGATYYNVQLYHGRGHKVLSVWPKQATLQLRQAWRFDGRRYHLKPGRYRWYVWPGFGRRNAADYGHAVGSGTFIVVR